MKKYYYLFICFIFCSCASSWKSTLISKGNENEAIVNAITDFSNTSKLRNQDNVFYVFPDDNNNDLFWGITIAGTDENKLYPGPEVRVGTCTDKFPTRYIEKNNKLYYWYDSTQCVSEEIVQVFSKYNHIDSTYIQGFNGEIPDYISNDSKKGVDYYFCKSDLRNYKKVTTNRAMGWYKAPKLKCSSY